MSKCAWRIKRIVWIAKGIGIGRTWAHRSIHRIIRSIVRATEAGGLPLAARRTALLLAYAGIGWNPLAVGIGAPGIISILEHPVSVAENGTVSALILAQRILTCSLSGRCAVQAGTRTTVCAHAGAARAQRAICAYGAIETVDESADFAA